MTKSTPPVPPSEYAPPDPTTFDWRATSVPSFFTPALSVMVLAGRLPMPRHTCSRLRNRRTGRPVFRASSGAITEYLPADSFAPKPPPM